MPMTFKVLTKDCTPKEVDALAWHLAQYRARKTFEALSSKHCFTYCGDDRCNCDANPNLTVGLV